MSLYKVARYFSFMKSLYGTNLFPVREKDIAVHINSLLKERCSDYLINVGNVKNCFLIFSEYREYVTRIYFDSSETVLDADQERWISRNKKSIKEKHYGIEDIIFILSFSEWAYKRIVDEYIKSNRIFTNDNRLTVFGEACYKMYLACQDTIESLEPQSSAFDKVQISKNVLDTRRFM